MSRYDDQIVDNYGRPVPGASVYVYDDAGALDTLTDDLAAPLDNPLTSDTDGLFAFNAADGEKTLDVWFGGIRRWRESILVGPPDPGPVGPAGDVAKADTRAAMAAIVGQAAKATRWLAEAGREGAFVWTPGNLSAFVAVDTVQGLYIAPASDPTGASGAWVRKFSGDWNFRWFGAVGNDFDGATGTNDGPAYAVAEALVELHSIAALVNPTIYRGGPVLDLGQGFYYFGGTPVDPNTTMKIKGAGGLGWGAPCRVRFAAGTDGVRVQAHNTSGATTVDGIAHYAGDRLHIEGICFRGGYNSAAPNEGEFHGIRVKRPVTLIRCTFENFQGDGYYCVASVGGGVPTEGNANMAHVIQCDFNGNRNGRYVRGSDANVQTFRDCQYNDNRQWNVDDAAFIPNSEYDAHASGGGLTAVPMPTLVHNLGNRFAAKQGQEAGASVNSPPATATDNTWWRFAYAGGVDAVVPTWFNGIVVRSGGAYTGNVRLYNCYEEGGQGPTVIAIAGAVYEGNITNKGSAPWVRDYMGWHRIGSGDGSNGVIVDGYSTFNGRVDVHGYLFLEGAGNKLQFSTGGVAQGYILNSGGSLYINAPAAGVIYLRNNDTDIVMVGASGLFPPTDNAYDLGFSAAAGRFKTVFAMKGNFATDITVGGNKVIGAQGAAVADVAAITSAAGVAAGALTAANVGAPAALTTSNAVNAVAAPTQAEFNAFVAKFNLAVADLTAIRTTVASIVTEFNKDEADMATVRTALNTLVTTFNQDRTDVSNVRTAMNTTLARIRAATGHGLIA